MVEEWLCHVHLFEQEHEHEHEQEQEQEHRQQGHGELRASLRDACRLDRWDTCISTGKDLRLQAADEGTYAGDRSPIARPDRRCRHAGRSWINNGPDALAAHQWILGNCHSTSRRHSSKLLALDDRYPSVPPWHSPSPAYRAGWRSLDNTASPASETSLHSRQRIPRWGRHCAAHSSGRARVAMSRPALDVCTYHVLERKLA